jgi:OOP family OmpA-OmpF porin
MISHFWTLSKVSWVPARPISSRRMRLAISLFALMWIGSTGSFAQSASEANDIIKSLAPIQGQSVTPGYAGGHRETVKVQKTTVIVDLERTVSLEIYFEFGSAKITRRARTQLSALGRALSSPQLAAYRYLIAGHTDAVGSDEYNLDLSERRAAAVRDYLISAFPIDPPRLMTVGFGFRRLKRPNAPHAAVNRRVQILLVVP